VDWVLFCKQQNTGINRDTYFAGTSNNYSAKRTSSHCVINHSKEPTVIHWHGIELENYLMV
jgi:hypothetical protein